MEKLETRAMLAGDIDVTADTGDVLITSVDTTPAFDTAVAQLSSDGLPPVPYASFAGPVVALALQITAPDGSPVGDLHVGDDFVLHVLARDLRADPQGVFAVYLDIGWDEALAQTAGALTYSAEYENGHAGDLSTPGQLDEAGAFGGTVELNGGLHEVFSVPMHAVAAGQLVFSTDPADVTRGNDILIYGENSSIDPVDIVFGGATVTISDFLLSDGEAPATSDAPSDQAAALLPADDAPLLRAAEEPAEKPSATAAPALLPAPANMPANTVPDEEDVAVVSDDNATQSDPTPIDKTQPQPEEDLLADTLLPKRDGALP